MWLFSIPININHQNQFSFSWQGEQYTFSGLPQGHINSSGLAAQSCLTLCDPLEYRPSRLLCPWYFSGKITGVGCFLLHQLSILVEFTSEAVWSRAFLCCEVFFITVLFSVLIMGLFRFYISLLFSFHMFRVFRNFSILSRLPIWWHTVVHFFLEKNFT